jgi:predicted RNase H-like nuclease (RuvC/YqgF family)
MNMETNTNQAQNNSTQQENQQQQTQVQETQSSASSAKPQSDELKFTQRDLDAIVRDRVNSLNSKIADLNSQLSAEKSKVADLTSKVEDFTNKDLVNKQGIPEQFADYAVFEAKKLTAADSKKSFEDAIKEVATKNASMFGIQTSNGATQTQGNPNQVQGRQPVTVGNTNTQGNANNSGNTVDAEVQAFLDKKFGKRR